MGNKHGKVAPGSPSALQALQEMAAAQSKPEPQASKKPQLKRLFSGRPTQMGYTEKGVGGRSVPQSRGGNAPEGEAPVKALAEKKKLQFLFRGKKGCSTPTGGPQVDSPKFNTGKVKEVPRSSHMKPSMCARIENVVPYQTGKLTDFYVPLDEKLGKGNFGMVVVCRDRQTGARVACKSIQKEHLKHKDDVEDVRREILIMRHLAGHEKIIDLLGVYEDERAVHLVMELCEGGPLSAAILRRRKFPEPEAAALFRQVAEAVRHAHVNGVMHRDLKPENILLGTPASSSSSEDAASAAAGSPPSSVKLADFGLAVYLRPWQQTSGVAGSPYYFAPEVVSGLEYGREADIWSLGVILYVLLSGMLPFYGDTEEEIFEKIRIGKVQFTHRNWRGVSVEAKNLILRMLMLEPRWRPTAEEVLAYPFFQRNCPEIK
eukprot:jgi/Mesen1/3727/ME000202S02815